MIKDTPKRAVRALLVLAAVVAASASLAEAPPRLTRAQKEQAEFLCKRTEFSRGEVRHLQRSADFPLLLAYVFEACPSVAAILSDGATASIAPSRLPRENDEARAPAREPEKKKEKKNKEGKKGI
ncbi:MAG: hypothetical protein ACK4NE_02960 [Albidovulum sp.]